MPGIFVRGDSTEWRHPNLENFLLDNGSVELNRYNDYIDIIKDQISCANEATQILQKTYNDLQSVDQNFQQHVRGRSGGGGSGQGGQQPNNPQSMGTPSQQRNTQSPAQT